MSLETEKRNGLLRRCAPRNDGGWDMHPNSYSNFKKLETTKSRVPAARCVRVLPSTRPQKNQRAQGSAGCPLHPRPRVQSAHRKRHTSIQVQPEHPALPAQWIWRLISCSCVRKICQNVRTGGSQQRGRDGRSHKGDLPDGESEIFFA